MKNRFFVILIGVVLMISLSIPTVLQAAGEDVPFLALMVFNQLRRITQTIQMIQLLENQVDSIRRGEVPLGAVGCDADALLQLKDKLMTTYAQGKDLYQNSTDLANNMNNWFPNGASGMTYDNSATTREHELEIKDSLDQEAQFFKNSQNVNNSATSTADCLVNHGVSTNSQLQALQYQLKLNRARMLIQQQQLATAQKQLAITMQKQNEDAEQKLNAEKIRDKNWNAIKNYQAPADKDLSGCSHCTGQ
jgi:hypothetical protein